MHNEPITFDPAVKEIAHEVSRLFARVREALRGGSGTAPVPAPVDPDAAI
ncbi:hypothetical protein [Streptomyces sp. NPDC047000]